jgi:hypothetical protein
LERERERERGREREDHSTRIRHNSGKQTREKLRERRYVISEVLVYEGCVESRGMQRVYYYREGKGRDSKP